MYQQPSYPTVQFLLTHGRTLATLCAGGVAFAAIVAAWTGGAPWIAPVGALFAAGLWVLLQSYVEVLAIIADTLLPK